MGKIGTALSYTGRIALLGTALHMGGITLTQYVSTCFSDQIYTQSQLERTVERKREELAPSNDYTIEAKLVDWNEGYSIKTKEGDYGIAIGGSFATETTVDHELYHILDGHLDGMEEIESPCYEFLMYLFWYEPQATIYETTGIEL